jgi:hypothetical protein
MTSGKLVHKNFVRLAPRAASSLSFATNKPNGTETTLLKGRALVVSDNLFMSAADVPAGMRAKRPHCGEPDRVRAATSFLWTSAGSASHVC